MKEWEFSDEEFEQVIAELDAEDPFWEANEDVDELLEALTITGRRKKGIIARRYRQKLSRQKGMKARRFASPFHLKRRARQAAIKMMRKRVAGNKGTQYKKLSFNDKANIDKRVHAKRAIVHKMASRLMPKIKAKELQRLRKLRSRKGKTRKQAHESFTPEYVRALVEAVDKMTHHLEKDAMNQIFTEEITEKDELALREKALVSCYEYNTLVDVFNRGVDAWLVAEEKGTRNPIQEGFDRVNAFIAGGEDDNDLRESPHLKQRRYTIEWLKHLRDYESARDEFLETIGEESNRARHLINLVSEEKYRHLHVDIVATLVKEEVDDFDYFNPKGKKTADDVFAEMMKAKDSQMAGDTAHASIKFAKETPGQKPNEKTVVDGVPTQGGKIKKPKASAHN